MIKILWSEIKTDVDKQTWRIAKVRIVDTELRSDAQEDESKTSLTFIRRYAEEGVSILSAYISEKLDYSNKSVSTDELGVEDWIFSLKEVDVNEERLAMLFHKFIVDYILYRWCMIWMPDMYKAFENAYMKGINDIQKELFALSTPLKKRRVIPHETDEVEVSYQ